MLRGRDESPVIIRSPLHVVEAADEKDSEDQGSREYGAALWPGAHGGDFTLANANRKVDRVAVWSFFTDDTLRRRRHPVYVIGHTR